MVYFLVDTEDTATVGGSLAGTVDPGSMNMTVSCTITWAGEAPVTDGAKQRLFLRSLPRNECHAVRETTEATSEWSGCLVNS